MCSVTKSPFGIAKRLGCADLISRKLGNQNLFVLGVLIFFTSKNITNAYLYSNQCVPSLTQVEHMLSDRLMQFINADLHGVKVTQ